MSFTTCLSCIFREKNDCEYHKSELSKFAFLEKSWVRRRVRQALSTHSSAVRHVSSASCCYSSTRKLGFLMRSSVSCYWFGIPTSGSQNLLARVVHSNCREFLSSLVNCACLFPFPFARAVFSFTFLVSVKIEHLGITDDFHFVLDFTCLSAISCYRYVPTSLLRRLSSNVVLFHPAEYPAHFSHTGTLLYSHLRVLPELNCSFKWISTGLFDIPVPLRRNVNHYAMWFDLYVWITILLLSVFFATRCYGNSISMFCGGICVSSVSLLFTKFISAFFGL